MEDKSLFDKENEKMNTDNSADAVTPVIDSNEKSEGKFAFDIIDVPFSPEDIEEGPVDVSTHERILPPDEIFAVPETPTAEPFTEEVKEAETELEGQFSIAELNEEEEPEEEDEDIDTEPQTKEEDEVYDEKKPRKVDNRFDFIELFVFTLLAVIVITSFFFRHSVVSGESMQNTLQHGEHLIISDFFYSPKRGDIIVCEDYSTDLKKPIVKRVIAIEGDTLLITEKGEVYVNGELQIEEYVFIDGVDNNPKHKRNISIEIGEGEIFVMGDHRNDSADSRDIGTISEDAILGKVLVRFYPFKNFKIF